MGVNERREREKTERRRAILRCAKELILLQGVSRVNIEDIARKAELSKATVYLYFSSKDVLFNEICEESARAFLEHFSPFMQTGLTGLKALKCLWRGYVDLFGHSEEMLIVFQVRSFTNSSLPIFPLKEQDKSPHVNMILETIKALIDQCKDEGIFAADLDTALATGLLLSMFCMIMESASRIPMEARKSPALIDEMTRVFQLILFGFAREGIDRTCLDITGE
jgi:AcrR family transcriptional regulator